MKKILNIMCSPRGDKSNSAQLSDYFFAQLSNDANDFFIDTLDLWQETLAAANGLPVSAKYKVMEGQALSLDETLAWQKIKSMIERFSRADLVMVTTPIWNFSIPYVLKHYIDIVTQPNLCFTWTAEQGYSSVLRTKPAVILSSSASDYQQAKTLDHDFGIHYLERWLTVYMNCKVKSVIYAPTASTKQTVENAKKTAFKEVAALANALLKT